MILAAIIFIVLGVLIKYGKMYFLIAGYNTMSKKEKEKYDIKGIATVFKNAMFGMAFMIIIGYCLSLFLKNYAIQNYAFWISIAVGTPILISEIKFKRI
jgi:hypothetical protein